MVSLFYFTKEEIATMFWQPVSESVTILDQSVIAYINKLYGDVGPKVTCLPLEFLVHKKVHNKTFFISHID